VVFQIMVLNGLIFLQFLIKYGSFTFRYTSDLEKRNTVGYNRTLFWVFGCIADKSYWLYLITLYKKPSILPVCDLLGHKVWRYQYIDSWKWKKQLLKIRRIPVLKWFYVRSRNFHFLAREYVYLFSNILKLFRRKVDF